MKRLIAAAVLGIILVALYTTSYFYITNTCNEASTLLQECNKAYEENKNSRQTADRLNKFWAKKEPLLSALSSHNKIDDIEEAILRLTVYSESDNKEFFYESSGMVYILIHQLLEDTKPGVHSIL